MLPRQHQRFTRFGLRTLFVLMGVVALALAAPTWIRDWRLRQQAPIRQAIAEDHFQGHPQVVRTKEGHYLLQDVLGDEYRVDAATITSVRLWTAEAEGAWSCCEGMGANGNGMRYRLERKNGRWTVKEATTTSTGCGIRDPSGVDSWARLSEIVQTVREGDLASRRDACSTLAILAREAPFSRKPQLEAILYELTMLREDRDPEIRRTAEQGLKAAGK